jgi:hypothetical protein
MGKCALNLSGSELGLMSSFEQGNELSDSSERWEFLDLTTNCSSQE